MKLELDVRKIRIVQAALLSVVKSSTSDLPTMKICINIHDEIQAQIDETETVQVHDEETVNKT